MLAAVDGSTHTRKRDLGGDLGLGRQGSTLGALGVPLVMTKAPPSILDGVDSEKLSIKKLNPTEIARQAKSWHPARQNIAKSAKHR